MNEKGTQVSIGLKRFKKTSTETQAPSVAEKWGKKPNVEFNKAVMDRKQSTKNGDTTT